MVEQFKDQRKLSEIVRQYVSAIMITTGERPYDYYDDDDQLEFGVANAKEEQVKAKRRKAKKKKTEYKIDEKLRESILPSIMYSDAQLRLLSEHAGKAMQQAREQAGERVIYCCGLIRIENGYECKADCQQRASIKRVNTERDKNADKEPVV